MLRMGVVLGLLAVSLAYMAESEWSRDFDTNVEMLERHGYTVEMEAVIQADQDENEVIMEHDYENEDYSWEEAKGYEECEEFMFWKKDGWKKGEKKNWESNDWDKDEGRYKMFGADDDDQNIFDSDEDEDAKGRRHHGKHGHHHHHHHRHHHRCPKPKPLDEICAEIECSKFEKLNISGCGYEARKVFAANWAQTPIDISDMAGGYLAAYMRLFRYRHGANDRGVQVAMTVPLLERWLVDEKYQLAAGYMHLYIPAVFQDNPPVPTDDLVSVVPWSDAVVYDRAFGGQHAGARTYKREFEMLWTGLAKQNITIYPYMSLTARYTRPGRDRQRMEVMFVDNGSM